MIDWFVGVVGGDNPKAEARLEIGLGILLASAFVLLVVSLYAWATNSMPPPQYSEHGTRVVELHVDTSPE